MKVIFGFAVFVLLIASASAVCDEGQVDVNTASFEKLQEFTGIGEVKAQAIIDYRTNKLFENVDELIEVNGIGPVTLENMKTEGACVSEEVQNSESSNENVQTQDTNTEIVSNSNTQILETNFQDDEENEEVNPVTFNTIKLNPKDIKTKPSRNFSDYAIVGLIGFSVLLAGLFAFRNFRYRKNELV